jgi:hypothetical protein
MAFLPRHHHLILFSLSLSLSLILLFIKREEEEKKETKEYLFSIFDVCKCVYRLSMMSPSEISLEKKERIKDIFRSRNLIYF